MTIVELQPTGHATASGSEDPPVLDLVVPLGTATTDVREQVDRLHHYLSTSFPLTWQITTVDGGDEALATAWETSDAAVVARLDLRGPTDPRDLLPLVAPLLSGHSDLAYATAPPGSPGAAWPRLIAVRRDRVGSVLGPDPIAAARRAKLRIHRVPLGPAGRSSAAGGRRGRPRLGREVVVFAGIGVLSTITYLALFVALRGQIGPFAANTLALALTAVANTAANRRFTFGVRERNGRVRHQLQGLLVFALALGITTGSLAALHAVTASPSRAVEILTLLVANLGATAVRFVLLRQWVFRSRTGLPELAG